MNRYHYIDDQGNISDALPLEALRMIGLPPTTKVLLEGSKQWVALSDVSQGGPVVFPAPPLSVPGPPLSTPAVPPPPTSQTPAAAASAHEGSPTQRASAFYPTFFLGLFLGALGIHRFYLAKIGTGVLQLATCGGLGVWWLVDMITILLGKFRDKKGAVIPNVHPKVSWAVFAVFIIMGIARIAVDSHSPASGSSGGSYTEQDMAGVFKSEATPAITVTLNSDGSSLTDFGGGTTFRGRWSRVGGDGIADATDAGGETFYHIESKDRIKLLMKPEDIKLVGLDPKPFYNRVK